MDPNSAPEDSINSQKDVISGYIQGLYDRAKGESLDVPSHVMQTLLGLLVEGEKVEKILKKQMISGFDINQENSRMAVKTAIDLFDNLPMDEGHRQKN
ncbi:hypothetical protein KW795_01505 [Candidatus Microgenomates bacterium]|nr:hypothetical protein [Candidatus Microgenomates bacterium]